MAASPQLENGYTKIANEIMEALAKIRINGEARQMLDVIIRKTYGFNKKEDMIATSQFVKATGLPNYAIHKSRYKLVKMGIIEVSPKKVIGVTQKGYSQVLTYTFQKDYTKWKPLPKKVTVTQKGNELSPKKVTNCNPKSDTQKKERNYTKEIAPIDFLTALKNNKAYQGIDIEIELLKMDAWLLARPGRQKTRRFVVGWLNKIDKPIETVKPKKPILPEREVINEEEHKKVVALIHATAQRIGV